MARLAATAIRAGQVIWEARPALVGGRAPAGQPARVETRTPVVANPTRGATPSLGWTSIPHFSSACSRSTANLAPQAHRSVYRTAIVGRAWPVCAAGYWEPTRGTDACPQSAEPAPIAGKAAVYSAWAAQSMTAARLGTRDYFAAARTAPAKVGEIARATGKPVSILSLATASNVSAHRAFAEVELAKPIAQRDSPKVLVPTPWHSGQ